MISATYPIMAMTKGLLAHPMHFHNPESAIKRKPPTLIKGDFTMRTETIIIKGKVAKAIPFEITKEYQEPETWEEAVEMDTYSKAFKTYLCERKTNFMDKERKAYEADVLKKLNNKDNKDLLSSMLGL